MPERSPLMSAAKTGTPFVESCSASSSRRLGLPGAGRPGDQPVPVQHSERDPDVDVGQLGGVEHQPAELECGPFEPVPGSHRRGDGARWSLRHTGESSQASPPGGLRTLAGVIFKRVGDGRPYPPHDLTSRAWAALPPRQVRLDELVTTKDTLRLDTLLDEDSTFYGDLFAHVVRWRGELYLEDGLHRALRAALHQRHVLHARVHEMAADA